MVTEQKRGYGIAKKLLEEFENKLDTNVTDLFIRVWDKNVPALTLYEKQGYTSVASILQHKLEIGGASQLLMRKMYLHKKAGISYEEINHKNY
jgi:ribosomal protein S18 acetylase RimI-like enzyme